VPRRKRTKDAPVEPYGLEGTPEEVYNALLRLEGHSRAPKGGNSWDEDDELVQAHIKKKCDEIKQRKTELDIHPTETSLKNRFSEMQAERGAYMEQEIGRLSKWAR